ncbi:unnamed protein product [Protopolystoma xenopodis]|uniref:Uncharacterized protein n=1 Tax=Protopolystoma xenopodis TaxID=117903 RepID=A0A3S5CRA0_9PLAT|nr:unnamed protein product [Protopolystoma xenopodis]
MHSCGASVLISPAHFPIQPSKSVALPTPGWVGFCGKHFYAFPRGPSGVLREGGKLVDGRKDKRPRGECRSGSSGAPSSVPVTIAMSRCEMAAQMLGWDATADEPLQVVAASMCLHVCNWGLTRPRGWWPLPSERAGCCLYVCLSVKGIGAGFSVREGCACTAFCWLGLDPFTARDGFPSGRTRLPNFMVIRSLETAIRSAERWAGLGGLSRTRIGVTIGRFEAVRT